jgi:tetratricopeptide (TPR) repeat protein
MHRKARGENKAWAQQAELEIKTGQCDLYHVWGVIKMYDGQPDKALLLFPQSLALAQELNYQEGVAKAQNGLGLVLMDKPETWREAENYLQQALSFYQKMGRQTYLAILHGNLALFYSHKLNQPLKALFHGQESLTIHKKSREPLHIAQAAQNLAEIYLKLGQLAEAKYHAGLALEQEIGEVIPDAWRTLGEVALGEGNFAEAEKQLQASLKLCEESHDSYLAGYAWRAFMRLYQATQQPELLQNAYQQAVAMFTACHDLAEVADTQQLSRQLQYYPVVAQS